MDEPLKKQEMLYASFTLRMLASVIDTILSSIVLVPIFNLFNKIFKINKPDDLLYASSTHVLTQEEAMEMLAQSLPSFLFQTTVIAVVVIIFWIYKAATPGKMILKMKIVDAKTGKPPSKGQSIIRYLGYFVSTLPLCAGFLWIYFDKKKQGFHDKIAGTAVVKT